MGSEKIFMSIIIVFMLITIYSRTEHACGLKEKLYAANWTGATGASSVRPVVESFSMPTVPLVPTWAQPKAIADAIRFA